MHSAPQSIGHSVGQLVGEFSQSVSQPFNRLISQRIHPVSQSVSQSGSQSVSHTISLSVRVVKEERLFRDVNKIIKQALQYAMKKWVFFKGKLSLGYYYLNGPFPALWSFDFRIILSTVPNSTTNSGGSHRARRSLIIEKLIWFSNEWYVNPV